MLLPSYTLWTGNLLNWRKFLVFLKHTHHPSEPITKQGVRQQERHDPSCPPRYIREIIFKNSDGRLKFLVAIRIELNIRCNSEASWKEETG